MLVKLAHVAFQELLVCILEHVITILSFGLVSVMQFSERKCLKMVYYALESARFLPCEGV